MLYIYKMAFSLFSSINSINSLINKSNSGASSITQRIIQTNITLSAGNYDYAIGISKNGQYIGYVNNSQQLYISSNYGSSFIYINTLTSYSADFQASQLYISNNGAYILTVYFNSNVLLSTNSGSTFTSLSSVLGGSLRFASMSASGQYQAVIRFDTTLYISTDFGSNWTNLSATNPVKVPNEVIVCIINSTGQYMVAIKNSATSTGLGYYYSTDYGSSWTVSTTSSTMGYYGRSIYQSDDGSTYVAGWGGVDKVTITKNKGLTHTFAEPFINNIYNPGDWFSYVINSTGTDVYFLSSQSSTSKIKKTSDNLQTSIDYGNTVVGNSVKNNSGNIYASANCKYIVTFLGSTTDNTGKLYITTNNNITEGSVVSDTDLLNYYTFNTEDVNSAILKNIKTGTYDLTLVGTPIVTTNPRYGTASMKGSGNYGYMKTPVAYNNSAFSICFWYYVDGLTSNGVQTAFICRRVETNTPITSTSNTLDQQLELRINTNGNGSFMEWVLYVWNTPVFILSGGSYNLAKTWVHVALIKSGTNTLFYLNGVLKYTDTSNSTAFTNGQYSSFSFMKDYKNNSRDALGYMDDLRIYGRALSASELITLAIS